MERNWQSIKKFFSSKENILITTHLNPDGDAIGSEIALALFLKEQHKRVYIVNSDPTPVFFQFLDKEFSIEQFDEIKHRELLSSCDGCLIVDASEWKRLGTIHSALRQSGMPIACIDHHIGSNNICHAELIDNTASSTGELVYDFLIDQKARFTQTMLDALYTCILTDTGSFRFSNTTPRTHRIAADLLERGADFQLIYSTIFESNSKHRTWLKGELLANLHFEENDRLAWFVMPQSLLEKTGAHEWEAEGFSELPRTVNGVEISIMFTETKEGLAKASFRSRGNISINELAQQFGGGGHKYAAGAALSVPLEPAIKSVVAAAKTYLAEHRT